MNLSPRRVATLLHRYAGLFMAAFLILSGLTGSVIAFHHELDRWLNPGVLTVEPSEETLPVEAWIAAVEEAYSERQVSFVIVPQKPNEPATLFLDAPPGEIDQVFVHPGTAEVLGARDRDGFRFDRLHAMPFIHTFHYSLHLGKWGMWIFGGIAIVWFFDCFVGLYLGWPKRTWKAIKQAFGVKWGAGKARVNYDLHRAGGLWIWIVLAVLAFSGFSMNLHDEVFDPMVNAVAPMTPFPGEDDPDRDNPSSPLSMTVSEAIAAGDDGLEKASLTGNLGSVWLNYAKGLYHLAYHTDQDIMRAHPGTWVSIDTENGKVIDVRPAGGHTVGDAIHDWQFPLHSGKAFGLTGRIIICISGLLVAMLSVTGVLIWWRKRKRQQGL